jgi:hypothetical protein
MRILPTFFVVAAFQCMLFAGTVYNPVTDFNTNAGANPDGVWSYGKWSGGSFSLLGYFDGSDVAIKYWENVQGTAFNYPAYYPYMTVNTTGHAFIEDGYSVPAGSLFMAPGPADWFDLRFTAPATGIYDFNGQFEFLAPGGYMDYAYVFRNETPFTINNVLLNSPGQTVAIDMTGVSLTAGDLMDFAIRPGTSIGNANALQLDVTQEQTGVPEPSTFGFAALSAACFLIRLRRK